MHMGAEVLGWGENGGSERVWAEIFGMGAF